MVKKIYSSQPIKILSKKQKLCNNVSILLNAVRTDLMNAELFATSRKINEVLQSLGWEVADQLKKSLRKVKK